MLIGAFCSALLGLTCLQTVSSYNLVREYAGQSFFNDWDFYGYWDNLTLGNVNYLSYADATSQKLAYINQAGNAVLKVDNTSNIVAPANRNSVRITSKDFYDVGSLLIFDVAHIPYGCSTWPAIWTTAPNWPDGGEIDIVEAINMMNNNQMALHTLGGCTKTTPPNQLGKTLQSDCSLGSGCVVAETKPNSWGNGFTQAGGGVFALQLDVSGVYMWFWGRPDVPASITHSTPTSSLNLTDWGNPSGSWPASSCNVTQFFKPQQIIIDITLCGDWAGVPSIYNSTCATHGPTGKCYEDNVVGPGSPEYDNAYFEIPSIRAYAAPPPASSSSSSSSSSASSTSSSAAASRTPNAAASITPAAGHASPTPSSGTPRYSILQSFVSIWTAGVLTVSYFSLFGSGL